MHRVVPMVTPHFLVTGQPSVFIRVHLWFHCFDQKKASAASSGKATPVTFAFCSSSQK